MNRLNPLAEAAVANLVDEMKPDLKTAFQESEVAALKAALERSERVRAGLSHDLAEIKDQFQTDLAKIREESVPRGSYEPVRDALTEANRQIAELKDSLAAAKQEYEREYRRLSEKESTIAAEYAAYKAGVQDAAGRR